MFRIMLAGIGGYGDNYLAELLDHPAGNICLSGICDPFAAKSPRYAQIQAENIPVYASPDEYFAEQKKSGLETGLTVIASPIHTHYGFMKSALIHGSSVLCEKPPCTVLGQFGELEALEKGTGLFIGVGFQQCYARNIQEMKKDIASGLFGKPVMLKSLRLMRRGKSYYTRNSWAGKIGSGDRLVLDSPLNNACAHEFQNMLFVLGSQPDSAADVENVTAKLYRANPDIENYDAVALRACAVCGDGTKALRVPVYYYAAHCVEEEKTGPFNQYVFEKAIIEFDGGFYAKDIVSGKLIKDYRIIDAGLRLQKLYDCIGCAKDAAKPVCRLKTCYAHMKTVHMVQESQIKQISGSSLVTFNTETDSFYAVKNLGSIFTQHYNSATLPGDGEII